MRKILCFGDSNTYGFSPIDGSRYPDDVHWPGVLNGMLGDKFEVINEGKNGRTVAFDDPYNEGCNGMNDIGPCLDANAPVDLIIVMLGTNDLKVYFEATPQIIADHLREMCQVIREKSDARILLASPMLLGDQIEFSPLHLEFGRQQVDYSFELAPQIEKVAREIGAEFIDLAVVAMSSDVDCLHLMPEEHAKIAQAMKDKVYAIFKEELEQEAEEERLRQEEEERKRAEEEAERQRQEEEARQKAELEAAQAEREAAQAEREAAQAGREVAQAGREAVPADAGDGRDNMSMGSQEFMGNMEFVQPTGDAQMDEDVRMKAEAIFRAAEEEVARESMQQEDRPFVQPVSPSSSSGLEGGFVMGGDFGAAAEEEHAETLEDVLDQVELTNATVSEKKKMLAGKLYRCDAELKNDLAQARKVMGIYNQTTFDDTARREKLLSSLFGYVGLSPWIEPPFYCDYGYNISLGDNFYANFGCIMLDVGKITIGSNVFFGPNVNVYTAGHPIYAPIRNELLEYSKEVTIGDDVWIGGNVTINPGVHIGNNVVIGSGSVVTSDIPDGVVAAGNPCRILRRISDSDRQYWEKLKLEHDEE